MGLVNVLTGDISWQLMIPATPTPRLIAKRYLFHVIAGVPRGWVLQLNVDPTAGILRFSYSRLLPFVLSHSPGPR